MAVPSLLLMAWLLLVALSPLRCFCCCSCAWHFLIISSAADVGTCHEQKSSQTILKKWKNHAQGKWATKQFIHIHRKYTHSQRTRQRNANNNCRSISTFIIFGIESRYTQYNKHTYTQCWMEYNSNALRVDTVISQVTWIRRAINPY